MGLLICLSLVMFFYSFAIFLCSCYYLLIIEFIPTRIRQIVTPPYFAVFLFDMCDFLKCDSCIYEIIMLVTGENTLQQMVNPKFRQVKV